MKLTPKEFDKLQKFRKSNLQKQVVKRERKPKLRVKRKTLVELSKEVQSIPYSLFLTSEYWNEIKKIIHERDKNKCTVCGRKGELHVHHTTYKHVRKEYNHLEDLQLLCSECHYNIHCTIDIK